MEQTETDVKHIGIIGAGVSGIAAAIQLHKKGYRVTVFEKDQKAGGKCLTINSGNREKEQFMDMGATVVAVSFRHILQWIREIKAPLYQPNPYKVMGRDKQMKSLRSCYFPKGKRLKILRQAFRFLRYTKGFKRRQMSHTGYKTPMAPKYEQPFSSFCANHKLNDLLPWFDLPIRAWGYSQPKQIPSWYVFGEIDFWGFLGLAMTILYGKSSFVKSLREGYGHLMEQLADRYKLNIKLDTPIQQISRTEKGVEVKTSSGNEKFDFIFLTDPRMVSLLENPSTEEIAFYEALEFSPYATVWCEANQVLDAKVLVELNLSREKGLKLIAAPLAGQKSLICYLNIPEGFSEAEVRKTLLTELDYYGFTGITIKDVRLWKHYFPHFPSFSAYESLLAAQGQQRTLYLGSINQFEFVEAAAATAIHLVDQYFPHRHAVSKEKRVAWKNLRYILKK